MSTEEELRAKARVKIDELEKEAANLRVELETERRENTDAWNMYGGELCVADMHRSEQDLEEKIREVERKIALLKNKRTAFSMSHLRSQEAHCKQSIQSIDDEIKRLYEDKADYQKILAETLEVKLLLGID